MKMIKYLLLDLFFLVIIVFTFLFSENIIDKYKKIAFIFFILSMIESLVFCFILYYQYYKILKKRFLKDYYFEFNLKDKRVNKFYLYQTLPLDVLGCF